MHGKPRARPRSKTPIIQPKYFDTAQQRTPKAFVVKAFFGARTKRMYTIADRL
jgi:hypothetical protein